MVYRICCQVGDPEVRKDGPMGKHTGRRPELIPSGVRKQWRGLVGSLDSTQSAAVLGTAVAGAAWAAVHTARRAGTGHTGTGRTPIGRSGAIAAVGVDLIGGLVAFQLPPTRDKYAQSSARARLIFALCHAQPFLLPLLREGSWRRAAFRYLAGIAAITGLQATSLTPRDRRIAANAVAAGVSIADFATDTSPQRWFGPVFTMKVIGGHGGLPPATTLQ